MKIELNFATTSSDNSVFTITPTPDFHYGGQITFKKDVGKFRFDQYKPWTELSSVKNEEGIKEFGNFQIGISDEETVAETIKLGNTKIDILVNSIVLSFCAYLVLGYLVSILEKHWYKMEVIEQLYKFESKPSQFEPIYLSFCQKLGLLFTLKCKTSDSESLKGKI